MISNFNEVEKSLKRCLKEKISITTATVVGFLIAGTVAFGGLIPDIPTGDDVITISEPSKYYITDPNDDLNATVNVMGKEIVINGEKTASGAATSSVFLVKSNATLENKATIWVIDNGEKGYAQAMGNYYKEAGTVINEGKIYVDGTDIGLSQAEDRIKGIGIDAGAAYNKGIIIVNDGSGMTDNSGTSEKIIVNDTNGTITVEGGGVGIYHRMEAITEGSVENKGTIKVTGTGTGVLLSNGNRDSAYDGKKFINSGKIIANNSGTAIKTFGTEDATIKLVKGSHIEGLIHLLGTNNTVDIDGVGTDDNPEENNIKSNDVNVKIDNSNIILKGTLNSQQNKTTVVINNVNGKTTLVNDATISGNIGMHLNGTDTNNKIEVTNTKDGSITVSGENAIGVKVDGVTTTFTNDGTITLKEGTVKGTGISINKGTATNNGTIALGLGTIENSNNNIAIKNEGGTAKNTGKIKITDKTSEELKDFDISTLFNGSYDNTGMIVGKDGIAIKQEGDTVIAGDTDTGTINNAEQEGSNVVITGGVTIKGSADKPIKVESLNVTGKVTIANGEDGEEGVEIAGTTTNLDANGSLAIGSGASKAGLTITNGTVNAEDNGTAVTFENVDSTLTLTGTTFNGNIGSGTTNGTVKTSEGEKATVITGNIEAKSVELAGTTAITGNIETKSMAVTAGETKIDGIITGATKINIGTNPETEFILLSRAASTSNNPENATVIYSADSKIIGKGTSGEENRDAVEKTKVTIAENGILKAEVDNDGKNLFGNSTNINVSGAGTIQFLVSNVTKENLELQFETTVSISGISNILTDSEFYSYDNTNKMLSFIKNNVNNKDLADIYNKSFVINNVLAQTRDAREAQLDSIYSNNVYSETVKMSMDTLRMNEEAVLSLGGKPEEGKWTAQGKMLFSRTEYDRDGKVNSYGVETKTAGLLGALEYGLSEKSSVGFAFSGTKQDLDMKKASADGDAFYFGVYGKQDINNFKLTAGLGYQLNKIDADNDVIVSTGDKYDSKAFSGYAQGKYVINAGNDVTVEPKVKLALTRLTQESAKDKHFKMEKENITTFDTEVGVDLVKSVKLESGKMNLLAGISYTRTVGDTDDKFKGNFIGTDGTRGDKFDLIGANLGENTLKINIGAEVEKDNGFFYNGGLNYKFDNEDRETFGATIGAGYKF
ncbi:autotransporter domain-containing protein [Fusobacterium varium]|mgnify:CR=1 FL=1|uniref:autotransporter domain-containing protein n=1 Tax=Fusobacterium varium TaxID=856 RepID=UPI002431F5CC|nr:autotransporter domain-containing protein [Fusobacterium varium]MCF0168887.1 autotransporter domain-containing protein [Fusobacterium varium]